MIRRLQPGEITDSQQASALRLWSATRRRVGEGGGTTYTEAVKRLPPGPKLRLDHAKTQVSFAYATSPPSTPQVSGRPAA